ncbi:molybdopterin-dependent oxidoreductase, partial [Chloroflexota bacterium]
MLESIKAKKITGEKIVRTTCHLCHGGCVLLAHVNDGKLVFMEGDPDGPHNRGSICPKGAAAPQIVHSPYRIKYPLKRIGERGEGEWQRITWEEAFSTIVEKLKYYRDTYGGESIAFMWGTGRQVQLTPWWNFFSEVLGTPNGAGVGHMCLSKTRSMLTNLTLGKVHGPTSRAEFRDFDNAACIVGWGDTMIDSTNDRM